jgi:hypothetical protein
MMSPEPSHGLGGADNQKGPGQFEHRAFLRSEEEAYFFLGLASGSRATMACLHCSASEAPGLILR